MKCQRCGYVYKAPWMAPHDLWQGISGEYDILCSRCFGELALAAGFNLHWHCETEEHPIDTELLALETRLIEAGEVLERIRIYNAHLEEILGS